MNDSRDEHRRQVERAALAFMRRRDRYLDRDAAGLFLLTSEQLQSQRKIDTRRETRT